MIFFFFVSSKKDLRSSSKVKELVVKRVIHKQPFEFFCQDFSFGTNVWYLWYFCNNRTTECGVEKAKGLRWKWKPLNKSLFPLLNDRLVIGHFSLTMLVLQIIFSHTFWLFLLIWMIWTRGCLSGERTSAGLWRAA